MTSDHDEYGGDDGLGDALRLLAADAPPLAVDRLRAARRRARRRLQVAAGAGSLLGAGALAAATVALAGAGPGGGNGHATLGARPSPSITSGPTASARPSGLDARPSTPPPAVPTIDLGAGGSSHALRGEGWQLDVSGGEGTVGIGIDRSDGSPVASQFVYTRFDNGASIPVTGIAGDGVASLGTVAAPRFVAYGAVPRGTVGVAVLDSLGHRGWATLFDPGPDDDTLFYAYEPPDGGSVVSLEALGAGDRVIDSRNFTPHVPGQADPGQAAAAGLVRIERPIDSGNTRFHDLCLVVNATGAKSCDEDFIGDQAFIESIRLPDGRLAVGGRIAPGDTSVSFTTASTGVTHTLTVGLPGEPTDFLWVGDAPQPPSVMRTRAPLVLPSGHPAPSGFPTAACTYTVVPPPITFDITGSDGKPSAVSLGPLTEGNTPCSPIASATP